MLILVAFGLNLSVLFYFNSMIFYTCIMRHWEMCSIIKQIISLFVKQYTFLFLWQYYTRLAIKNLIIN